MSFDWAYSGDFDGQCDVDLTDVGIFAPVWLTEPGDAGWNPDCDISIPADNSIDIGLFILLAKMVFIVGVE